MRKNLEENRMGEDKLIDQEAYSSGRASIIIDYGHVNILLFPLAPFQKRNTTLVVFCFVSILSPQLCIVWVGDG